MDTLQTEVAAETVEDLVQTVQRMSPAMVLKMILMIAVLIVLVELLCRFANRLMMKSRMDKSLHGFLRTGVRILLYFLAAIIVAGSLKVDVTSLIAVLSVVGLAISLALQGALSNVAGGIVILTTKPFKVGDYVLIDGHEGFVDDISMTYTRLSAYDKRIIFIPNSTVTSVSVENFTRDGLRRVQLDVSASYDCGVDQVKDSILEAIQGVSGFLSDPAPVIRLQEFGESAIAYRAWAWCEKDIYWDCHYLLLEEIKRTFDRNGVIFTYNHLNVHLDQV